MAMQNKVFGKNQDYITTMQRQEELVEGSN